MRRCCCFSVRAVVALLILVLLFDLMRKAGGEPDHQNTEEIQTSSTCSSSFFSEDDDNTTFSDTNVKLVNSFPFFNQRKIIDYCTTSSNLEYDDDHDDDFNRSDTCPLAEDIVRSAVTDRIYSFHHNHKDNLSPALLHLLFHDCFIQVTSEFQPSQSNYDYFVLAQQWPKTVCFRRRCAVKTLPNTFTLHGLWPSNFNQSDPEWCLGKGQGGFDEKLISSNLKQQLKSDWPDIVHGNDQGFWSRQWDKHGTCSINSFPQLDYLKLALDLRNRFTLIDALRQKGIMPDRTSAYPVGDIENAIKVYNNNTKPGLMCTKGMPSYLQEIRLCLISDGSKYMDCPPALIRKDCPSDVLLPPP